jgi:diguanylate cyclase (GGDEF)-like protein
VDQDLKKYADTLYENAQMESISALGAARTDYRKNRAARNQGNLPIGGSDIRAMLEVYDAHIERCMSARLESYERAYSETNRIPSEQDFTDVLSECKEVRVRQIIQATKAIKESIGARSPAALVETVQTSVEGNSAHGHDRVLRRWKIWKAKTQLKPPPTKVEEREKQRDGLVLTYNRAEFNTDVPGFTSESGEEHPCSLLFLDLDNFKLINTVGGHEGGDRALKAFAETLVRVCTGKGTVYRYGGDEFCVLLPNHSLDEAVAVAERICNRIRAIKTEERPNGLTTSIGVACFPESNADPSKLVSEADRAMYVSKNAGGDRVSKTCSEQGSASRLKVWERL